MATIYGIREQGYNSIDPQYNSLPLSGMPEEIFPYKLSTYILPASGSTVNFTNFGAYTNFYIPPNGKIRLSCDESTKGYRNIYPLDLTLENPIAPVEIKSFIDLNINNVGNLVIPYILTLFFFKDRWRLKIWNDAITPYFLKYSSASESVTASGDRMRYVITFASSFAGTDELNYINWEEVKITKNNIGQFVLDLTFPYYLKIYVHGIGSQTAGQWSATAVTNANNSTFLPNMLFKGRPGDYR